MFLVVFFSVFWGYSCFCYSLLICVHIVSTCLYYFHLFVVVFLRFVSLKSVCLRLCPCVRLDRRGHTFQVQLLPRSRTTSKEEELKLFGEILHECVMQNTKPPSVVSYDNHGSFEFVNRCLLGYPPKEAENFAFWKGCIPDPLMQVIPLFRGRLLRYGPDGPVVFGCNDPKHVLKARPTAVSSELFSHVLPFLDIIWHRLHFS